MTTCQGKLVGAALVALILFANFAISYGFARLGEPRSVWFWRLLGANL